MIDTDFESNPTAALLTNDGYFARHRELAQTMSSEAAWEQVESELPFGFKRFSCVQSFRIVRTRFLNGENPRPHFTL